MMEEILNYINNFFVEEIREGTFTITEGKINELEIDDVQYYRIVGSVFNDGVYQGKDDLEKDETFEGEIWLMAVPRAVIKIAKEIEEWTATYADKMNSPYQSESFGGYSYSKASGSDASGEATASWKTIYGSRLKAWRRMP